VSGPVSAVNRFIAASIVTIWPVEQPDRDQGTSAVGIAMQAEWALGTARLCADRDHDTRICITGADPTIGRIPRADWLLLLYTTRLEFRTGDAG
jgi:hypothetical protein